MSSAGQPPNKAVAELIHVLGDENVRTLVRTFLREFPQTYEQFARGDRKHRHRLAHSMKSNSRLMGALELSQRMAALEARLGENADADVPERELAAITAEFETIAGPLRRFVGE